MKIYYQGNPGSYMHTASVEIQKNLNTSIESLEGKPDFQEVWKNIGDDGIAVLAIENSYMGSIHPNLYGFLKYDYKIIGDYHLPINHCLCSREIDISGVKEVYSQMPALEQCHKYIQNKGFTPKTYSDTALSAKFAAETQQTGVGAICSELAAKLYGLNILEKNIQDNTSNTTRFAIITTKNSKLEYSQKTGKISLLFDMKNIPASLYKSLGTFSINGVNLTKIESLPSYKGEYSVMFWVDIEGNLKDDKIQLALSELKNYTSEIRILGAY